MFKAMAHFTGVEAEPPNSTHRRGKAGESQRIKLKQYAFRIDRDQNSQNSNALY
jgi:hypothetical protein